MIGDNGFGVLSIPIHHQIRFVLPPNAKDPNNEVTTLGERAQANFTVVIPHDGSALRADAVFGSVYWTQLHTAYTVGQAAYVYKIPGALN